MKTRIWIASLVALATVAFAIAFLERSYGSAPDTPPNSSEEVKRLQASFDKVGQLNKELMDELKKLRTEHESVRDDHNKKLAGLLTAVPANKTASDTAVSNLKKYFEDQNLRIEWRRQTIGVTPDAGQDQEIDFGKPVVEAVAVVSRFHFHFRGNDDHHVRQVIAEAEVIQVQGSKVKVKCHAWMDDNSNNRSDRFGMTYVVIARIKS